MTNLVTGRRTVLGGGAFGLGLLGLGASAATAAPRP